MDEVQTGMGRTGSWLVHVDEGIRADITLAKGLGNGFPIGACLATGPAARLLGPGSHGSTFGGNPVAAIAGLAVIAVIERDDLLSHVTAMGEHLKTTIDQLGHPLITGVRGRGLLRGITFAEPVAAAVADAALDAGFIVNAPARTCSASSRAAGDHDSPARHLLKVALPGLIDRTGEAA